MEEAIALDSIQAIAASFGASFDAEKIVDTVLEKDGTRYYKVRWVKYSWEPAASFTHLEHLIRAFWNQCSNSQFDDVNKKQNVRAETFPNTNTQIVQRNQNTEKTIPQLLSNLSPSPITNLEAVQHGQQPLNKSQPQPPVLETNFTTHPLQSVDGETTVGGSHHSQLDIISNLQSAISLPLNTGQLQNLENGGNLVAPLTKRRSGNTFKKRRKIPGTCDICGKHFKSTTNIAAHKKLHTEDRQFACQQCGKKFRRKLHLTRHLESHAGIKGFECEICGSKFSSKWYMEAHKVIHTGDKPFECSLCNKKFNNKANLNKHKLIHANKRPFVCNLCGQTHRQGYDLKRHMLTHTNLKSFICPQCGKCFARKSYLQRHLVTHESERKFNCSLCNQTFGQRSQLNWHLKKHEDGEDFIEEEAEENEGQDDFSKEIERDTENENERIANDPIDAVEAFLNSPSNAAVTAEASAEVNRKEKSESPANTVDSENCRVEENVYQNGGYEETVVIDEGKAPTVANKTGSLDFVEADHQTADESYLSVRNF